MRMTRREYIHDLAHMSRVCCGYSRSGSLNVLQSSGMLRPETMQGCIELEMGVRIPSGGS